MRLDRLLRAFGRHLHPHRHSLRSRHYSHAHAARLRALVDDFQPHLAVMEELWMARYAPLLRSLGLPYVYDAHNVESRLHRDRQQAQSHRPTIRQRLKAWSIRASERTLTRDAAQVWACSRLDAESLMSLYGPLSDVRVIPNTIDTAAYRSVRATQGQSPPVMILVGRFAYPPNRRAAHVLLDEIFPAVRRRHPTCRLHLVGGGPSAYMRERAAAMDALTVTGFVDDVRPYLADSTIAVVPLTEGGGTRLKIIEAFASHLPVVSTAKGAEGLDVTDGTHIRIANSPTAMAEAASHLLARPDRCHAQATAAHKYMQEKYSWAAVQPTIRRALRDCADRHLS